MAWHGRIIVRKERKELSGFEVNFSGRPFHPARSQAQAQRRQHDWWLKFRTTATWPSRAALNRTEGYGLSTRCSSEAVCLQLRWLKQNPPP